MAARVTTRPPRASMIEPMLENDAAAARLPLLFLVADTGGGHRNAARAVGQALERMYPGRFAPALCDPLGGPGSARVLRFVAGLYGPATRLAPWLWGAAYHACAAPLLLTSHLPGRETGNTEIVTRAGAGCRARSVRRLLAELDGLRRDRERTRAMRAASFAYQAGLVRPGWAE
jgi:hypothetical protein